MKNQVISKLCSSSSKPRTSSKLGSAIVNNYESIALRLG